MVYTAQSGHPGGSLGVLPTSLLICILKRWILVKTMSKVLTVTALSYLKVMFLTAFLCSIR